MKTTALCLRLLIGLAVLAAGRPASAQLTSDDLVDFWSTNTEIGAVMGGVPLAPPARKIIANLLAKAQPDECFCGVPPMGPPYPPNPTNDPPPCDDCGIPKVNQAYVWGLAKFESNLWFGTAANVLDLVLGGYLGMTNPIQTASFVGEFRHSYVSQVLGIPAQIGDWRPPRIFLYDAAAGTLAPKEGTNLNALARARLAQTTGLRSAGVWPGDAQSPTAIAFLAGPRLATNGGVHFFAFHARTGVLLGSTNLMAFNNIRKWLVHGGVLYTGVGLAAGGGAVLRWLGDPAAPGYPFAFEVVGLLDGMPAEVAVHEDRLFASTWPGAGQAMSGLWMSPAIPPEGLRNAEAALWTKVWKADDYEPDPVVAATYGGGALASWRGHLYWGTMHVPGVSLQAHIQVYGEPADQETLMQAALGTHRAITIFRGRDFGEPSTPSGVVRLAYGLRNLPVYDPGIGGWETRPNSMGGQRPLFGVCGFGNPLNNYTWTMDTYKGDLYIGTMDFSYVGWDLLPLFLDPIQAAIISNYLALNRVDLRRVFGADLWRFVSPARPAVPVSRTGVGNYSSYGVRTMVSDSNHLYLGMANPMNLLTDTNDAVPEGGWELIRLSKKTDCPNDFDGDGRSDLVSYRAADGRWFIERTSEGYLEVPYGFPGTLAAAGDFDGDRRWDLCVYFPPEGRWYRFLSRLGPQSFQFGFANTIPVTADFDGDGRTDIGIYHPPSGMWYGFKSREGFWQMQFGFDGTTPVVADFDGDGRADLGVHFAPTSETYLFRSTEGYLYHAFGMPGAFPAAGDLDGDGRTDIGVFDSAARSWSFRLADGNGLAVAAFGLSGSRPLTGDFDGDGIGDLGSHLSSSGRWGMLNRGPGQLWSRTFGGGAVLPAADGE